MPPCRCGRTPETAAHLILHCTDLATQRRALDEALGRPLRTCRDLADATMKKESAETIVRWVLRLERLQEYRLAQRIAAAAGERIGGNAGGRGRGAVQVQGEAEQQNCSMAEGEPPLSNDK